ncbi:MAG TPA: right-handed parallel beta-helix repeat-containing protein [Micavibrio sp.]|nr:right-handed parallel beta-helix repeat-containing protein [Micavibrio sp.]
MRQVQSGIANNFGLVGKNIRRYLATTALTATGLMAIATPAFAEGSWSNFDVVSGSQTVTTPDAHTTNIEVHSMNATVKGDADIHALDTVNLNQRSSDSKYVVYDIKNDPTKIMGKLNANGRVYIFDQNGVIFGEASQVNVGGIVTSTGYISDENIANGKDIVEHVSGTGEIVNNGTITVAEGGLAAFVAPAVRNNGVINAKAGTVALASGDKVTLDLYGDDLISIEVSGDLENAIVENKGAIIASGGTVALTVAAAKDAVDSVVNMDGIIDVSSVSVKGGRIIVNGGKKGAVKIGGKLDASGQGGGDISIKGENVLVTSGGDIDAGAKQNGNGGSIRAWGDNNSYFFGKAYAPGGSLNGDGGFVEVSAGNSVAYGGLVDTTAANGKTGRFLIDPQHVVLGTIDPALMAVNIGLDILLGGAFPILIVDQQALANTLHTTDVDLWATETISTAEKINISEYDYDEVITPGYFNMSGPFWTWHWVPAVTTHHNGITSHDLTLAAPTVNIKHDITLGTGKLLVQDLAAGISPLGIGLLPAPHDIVVDELNLDGRIYKRTNLADASFSTLADDGQIFTTADNINVLSNKALIQQAVHFADKTTAAAETIDVAAGTYLESVLVDREVNLEGANAGYAGYDRARGPETIVDPSSPGFHVVTSGVTIDGFHITSTSDPNGYGVWVDHANNVTVKNNIIDNISQNAVFADGAAGVEVSDNQIDDIGSHGIHIKDSEDARILRNHIGTNGLDHNINGDGIRLEDSDGAWVKNNQITNTTNTAWRIGSGIQSISSDKVELVENEIRDTDWDGIRVDKGKELLIQGNVIDDAVRTGIYLGAVTKTDLIDNDIDNVGRYGIHADTGDKVTLDNNQVDDTGLHGVHAYKTKNLIVQNNDIGNSSGVTGNIKNYGIHLDQTKNALVETNIIENTVWDGVNAYKAEGAKITGNKIRHVGGNGIELLESSELAGSPGSLEVSLNKINDTGSHGILVDKSLKAQVLTNSIGLAGGAFNIKGDGIQLNKAHGARVEGNDTRYTTSTAHNIGSGIQSIGSDDIVLYDNRTRDTDWDGIRIEKGNLIVVDKNVIKRAIRTGIYTTATKNTTISRNDVDKVGHWGIRVNAGDTVMIDDNQVDKTALDGIYAQKAKNLTIQKNEVGKSGGNINRHGINVENSDSAIVYDNDVRQTKGHGIYVNSGSDYTDISYNDIRDVDLDGINVDGGFGVDIALNMIARVLDDGIQVVKSIGTDIYLNAIGLTGDDGIALRQSDFTDIGLNLIGLTGGDGIDIRRSDNVDILGNQILSVAGDGIYARRSDDLDVGFNYISNAGNDGIDVEKSDDADIFANFVRFANNSGVEVSGSDDVFVGYNLLSNNQTGFFAQGNRNGDIEVSGNVFYNNIIGAHLQSGVIDLTGPGNVFLNGKIALYFEANPKDPTKLSLVRAGGGHTHDGNPYDTYPAVPYNPTTFGGTIGQQYFRGQSGEFVYVADGSFVDPGTGEAIWLDGSESTYYFPLEGAAFTPAIDGANPAREAFLEDQFYHRIDSDNRGIFFFYPVPVSLTGVAPPIEQSLIFNRFGAFNGDTTGLNVQIASLPSVGGGTPATPAALNQITTFAGGQNSDPSQLNQIETAAGSDQSGAGRLNTIETASGAQEQSCWGNAVAAAGAGQVVNVVYTGGVAANLNQAATCGTGF